MVCGQRLPDLAHHLGRDQCSLGVVLQAGEGRTRQQPFEQEDAFLCIGFQDLGHAVAAA